MINDTFTINGFSKKGSYYYSYNDDLIFAIGLQKSNYSNSYYINIGIIVKKLNPDLQNPRDVDGDIRARFDFENDGKYLDCFELQQFNEVDNEKINRYLQDNINIYVKSVTSLDKLKLLLKSKPVMLYQTTSRARDFLGFPPG